MVFVDYNPSETSKYIFECIETLDSIIDECNSSSFASDFSSQLLYEFTTFSDELFNQYLLFKDEYSDEIPLFTKAYFRALKTAYNMVKSGIASKKRFSSLINRSGDVVKLFGVYKNSLNRLVSDFKKY
ncbi:MAG TPA: hypothetical protein VI790_02085 [Candidatus Nanoarchaeia archaeon]|nr:hypothetical protein [Candidatus Nanoarchaeia archaeon]